jgi:subtilisin family serine protease
MQPGRQLGAKRPHVRRLTVPAFVLVSLAGMALAVRGAASAVSVPLGRTTLTAPLVKSAPGLPRLDPRLAGLARHPQGAWAKSAAARELGLELQQGRVRVDVTVRNVKSAAAAVRRLGGTVRMTWHAHVIALVPPPSLPALSRAASVAFVRLPETGTEESVTGQEVAASLASALQAKGITGKGVKVAIIDGGFVGLTSLQTSGDAPTNVTTADFCGGRFSSATEHGTAVTEIVHEMAPDAQLYLACTNDEASVLDAERWAKARGAQIINFSVGYFLSGRGDGSGIVGSAAADARANGILWVSAAGNHAQEHWSGTFADANGNGYNDFAPGDETNSFRLENGEGVCGDLKWDEWPAAKSDFDLALYSSSNQLLVQSATTQNGSQPPIEQVCYQNLSGTEQTVGWAIFGANVVSTPRLDLFSVGAGEPLQYQTAAGSIVDPAASPGALAVGAVCWQNNALEFYSSQGPTIDGRIKPDIAAQDSVSSATYGAFLGACPSGFAGTSAASPTVAGAAALVEQANPSFKAAQLQAFLQQKSVVDIGTPGMDDQSGAGVLRLPTTLSPPDRTRPTARALPSKGKRGHVVKLYSRLFDDSGRLKVRDQVKQNGHVIKNYTTGFMSTPSAETGFVNWPAPSRIRGTITHCVRAQDRAGNVSAVTCARVTLSG